jgi:hypothetical protein
MLPYYSRFIDDSPIAMEQEQYKKYSNILTKLKSLGYLEE